MRKKAFFLEKDLLPVKLYKDDIDEIIKNIKGCFLNGEIKFSNEDYEFESLEEMKQHCGNKVKNLSIEAWLPNEFPYSSFSLEISSKVLLSSHGTSEGVKGLWYSLKEFLQRKSGLHAKILRSGIWGFILFILSILGVFLIIGMREKYPQQTEMISKVYVVVLCILLVFWILSIIHKWKGSIVFLDHKHEVSGFWERNRDQIITGIIYTVIGTAIGIFLTILFIK